MNRAENDAFSRCHPAVGLMFFVVAIGLGAMILHPAYIVASVLFSVTYYWLLRGGQGLKLLGLLAPLFLLLTFINPLLNPQGDHVLFYIYFLYRPYTVEALLYGMALAGMMTAMMLWCGCYNAVMTSDKFMTLFGGVIPTVSMLLLMVLRLVPNMLRKTKQLADARKCIGHGAAENATKKEIAVDSLNVFSALMTWALEGGVITGDSMRSRGYGVAKRTTYRIYAMTRRDVALLALMGALAAVIVAFIFTGGTAAEFTPVMDVAPIAGWNLPGFLAYCVFLSLPTVLYIKEDIQWHILRSRI